jgi:hypothetical protein
LVVACVIYFFLVRSKYEAFEIPSWSELCLVISVVVCPQNRNAEADAMWELGIRHFDLESGLLRHLFHPETGSQPKNPFLDPSRLLLAIQRTLVVLERLANDRDADSS